MNSVESRIVESIRAPIFAILLFETFALIARSYLQIELVDSGTNLMRARNLSYLVVPPILLLTMYPILKQHRKFLAARFSPRNLSYRAVVIAILIGVLLRIASWGQLIAFASFGVYRNSDPNAIVGPLFSFNCLPLETLLLHILVMSLIIPVIEETINRGFLLYTFLNINRVFAILLSSVLFAVFHLTQSIIIAFVAGIFLATYALNTGSLWLPVIAHATFNGLIALDWLCLQTIWNPNEMTEGLTTIGLGASLIFFAAIFAVGKCVGRKHTGAT